MTDGTAVPSGSLYTAQAMTRFRFVTPHRRGKWYPDLKLAQRFAEAIGAGFLERRTGQFVLYPEARMEVQRDGADPSEA